MAVAAAVPLLITDLVAAVPAVQVAAAPVLLGTHPAIPERVTLVVVAAADAVLLLELAVPEL
jgi:hypothetical protein